MDKYTELKSNIEKKISDFPFGFAFSHKQFREMMNKLGVSDESELLSLPNGGFIRKSDKEAYKYLMNWIDRETTEAMKDDEYLFYGFYYELGNREYGYTYDNDDTLSVFGLTGEDLEKDKRLMQIFKSARTKYLKNFEG